MNIAVSHLPLVSGHQLLRLPFGSTILSVGIELDAPCIFYSHSTQIDPSQEMEIGIFAATTSMCITNTIVKYIGHVGTFTGSNIHVFEVKSARGFENA